MVVDNIIFSGFKEFINELISIDQYYYEKGLSNKDKGLDGRVRLGNNQESVLEQIIITFMISDLSLLDLNIISSFASDIRLMKSGPSNENDGFNIQYGPSPFSSVINLEGVPDILRYAEESHNIYKEIKKKSPALAIQVSPIGCFKFKALVYFKGLNILSLFNGFIENFIYSHFEPNDSYDEKMKTVGGEIYKSFVSLFTKRYYQESTKSSLIEDYMIYDKYYSYIKKDYGNSNVSLAKVIHPCGEVNFFGDSTAGKLQEELSMFRKAIESEVTDKKTTSLYFACCSDFFTFLVLKNFVKNIHIVDFEKFDILYSDTSYRFPLNAYEKSTYEVRINMMLHHNKEARNIVLNDKSDEKFTSKTNLSDPSLRYGMILAGQQIRYLVEVNLDDVTNILVADNIPRLIDTNFDVYSIINNIEKLSEVFRKASEV